MLSTILKWGKNSGAQAAKPKFLVVSFFTKHNEYAEHAARLTASLAAHGIASRIEPIDNGGAWEHVCAAKARFVLDCWHGSDVPVVWLDADATVEAYPALFDQIESDFAVHRWDGWQFGSGTLYFGKSPAALALLQQWVLRCEADPITWDQVHLQSAWCDIAAPSGLTTHWLPRSYLQIFDQPEEGQPIIKHWQASRASKADGRAVGGQFRLTERGIAARRTGSPWRTPEEAFWIAQGTAHIKPELGYDFPEGFDVGAVLRSAIDGHFPVLEIGCGVGRIASLFTPDEYLGVDVNPNAIARARASLPAHRLRIIDDGYAYPDAPSALLYTVLLHVSDEALPPLLTEAVVGRERFVISEVMDSRWRREGDPPVFNRNPETYILMMQDLGFTLSYADKSAYERYDKEPWNVGRDSRLTTLAFSRTGRS
ncbi:hypothetical protein GJ689_21875 [Rhodoplanes serenus]|uniref:Methyltransferase domain-containing protein n=1 Tax=Rhodoplanes serenus TaxID=200615 RepID=A0A9X4XU12_9BRAD|nr:hypothetical protein [Rhodoplanes serenus]MTW18851.1 hypothetical protein [Rhodoplanes serenus]